MNKRLIKLPLLIMFFVLAFFLTTTISKAWYVMIIRVLYQYEDGTTESIEDILINDKIHIRATNSATLKSVKRLKLGVRE